MVFRPPPMSKIAAVAFAATIIGAHPVEAGDSVGSNRRVGITATAGLVGQTGTIGDAYRRDVYQPMGRMLSLEMELGPSDRGDRTFVLVGADFISLRPRATGHIVGSRGATLDPGASGTQYAYKVGVRRYQHGLDRSSPFVEAGIGLGTADLTYTTSDTSIVGEVGPDGMVGLFLGAGARTGGLGPVSGFAGLRVEGVRSEGRGHTGLIATARAGLVAYWSPEAGWRRRTKSTPGGH